MPTPFETLDDEQLVDNLQRGAFRYFETHTNTANGLVSDTSLPNWPCSIAAVGFGLTCLPIAVERGWKSRIDALTLALNTARFFETEQRSRDTASSSHRGFFYHFLDMNSGRRAWNSELSFIDTALLLAGLLAVASYFDGDDAGERELRDQVDLISQRIDWPWICDPEMRLRMGWKPGRGFLPGRWSGYSEALLVFLLGMGSAKPISTDCFSAWLATCAWSGDADGGYVHAGPLFIHLFPQAWLDLRGLPIPGRQIDWFENSQRAIAAQQAYAALNPNAFSGYGTDVWGLTACQGPRRRATLRNGARRWIQGYLARAVPHGPDDGTLAPWAPLACLPFTPAAALLATRRILSDYPELIRDGKFVDAFNPSVRTRTPAGWVAERCTGIDQGLLVVMIENHRSGLIWRLMAKSEVVRLGLAAAGLKLQTMPSADL